MFVSKHEYLTHINMLDSIISSLQSCVVFQESDNKKFDVTSQLTALLLYHLSFSPIRHNLCLGFGQKQCLSMTQVFATLRAVESLGRGRII